MVQGHDVADAPNNPPPGESPSGRPQPRAADRSRPLAARASSAHMSWTTLFSRAAQQGGCVTPALAVDHGVSRRALRDRTRREGWPEPFPDVFVCPGTPESKHQTVRAALLHCGPDAIAGGWTAAWLWGAVNVPPSPHEVLLPHAKRPRTHARIRTLRTRTLVDGDTTEVQGLPTTTLARTAGDLSGRTQRAFLRGMLIDGRQRQQLALSETLDVAERRLPAPGGTTLQTLCWELDEVRCDSVLEHRVRTALRKGGYPAPADEPVVVSTPTRDVQVDIAWPALKVGIEVDGFGSHSSRAHLETDQRRHNALVLGNWWVLRLGWWRFETGWAGFCAELAALLRSA